MAEKTEIIKVTPFRRRARKLERQIQREIDGMIRLGVSVKAENGYWTIPVAGGSRARLPEWTRGVRVQKAGLLLWAVVATTTRGH